MSTKNVNKNKTQSNAQTNTQCKKIGIQKFARSQLFRTVMSVVKVMRKSKNINWVLFTLVHGAFFSPQIVPTADSESRCSTNNRGNVPYMQSS